MKRSDWFTGWRRLVLIVGGLAILPAGLRAQAPDLPRLTKPDTSFSQKDLKKLLKQRPARDKITDAELEKIKEKHKLSYGRGFKPTQAPEMPPRGDLYASSVILTDGKDHTILPRNSLLHIPEKYKNRVIDKARGELILWPEFLKQNRTWIQTREVTMANATGDDPIPAERLEAMEILPRIVVSVLARNPISVMPPRALKPESETGGRLTKAKPGGAGSGSRGRAAQSKYRTLKTRTD